MGYSNRKKEGRRTETNKFNESSMVLISVIKVRHDTGVINDILYVV